SVRPTAGLAGCVTVAAKIDAAAGALHAERAKLALARPNCRNDKLPARRVGVGLAAGADVSAGRRISGALLRDLRYGGIAVRRRLRAATRAQRGAERRVPGSRVLRSPVSHCVRVRDE